MSTDDESTVKTNITIGKSSANPILVEVTRGRIVESRHRGAVAVVDTRGNVQASWGDISQPVYPRSSIKAFQALPLIETGAADEYGFTPAEIALACASHNGEPVHAELASEMLSKLGLSEADLECGEHWPMNDEVARALAASGDVPNQLHNNCSGKHAGMLAVAKKLGVPTKGYIKITHPVQQRILGTIEAMCGVDMRDVPREMDGCSAPTWAVPLENVAYGFARFAAPEDWPEARADACRRIAQAVADHPYMVAGKGRYCTEIMEVLGRRAFVKTGAEGYFCAALPDYGLGVALKCDDGATRAAEAMMTAVLRQIGVIDDADMPKLEKFFQVPLTNRKGAVIGAIQPSSASFSF